MPLQLFLNSRSSVVRKQTDILIARFQQIRKQLSQEKQSYPRALFTLFSLFMIIMLNLIAKLPNNSLNKILVLFSDVKFFFIISFEGKVHDFCTPNLKLELVTYAPVRFLFEMSCIVAHKRHSSLSEEPPLPLSPSSAQCLFIS